MMAISPGIGICRLVDFALRRSPQKVALIDDLTQITFDEIDQRANRLAGAFQRSGLRPHDRLALILPNAISFIVVEIAALRCGAVKVPLNIRSHINEVMYALKDCEPTILVCDQAYGATVLERKEELPGLRAVYIVGGELAGAESYAQATSADFDTSVTYRHRPNDPVLIRYTGGTTGKPKGIVHANAAYVGSILDGIREFSINESDVALHLGHLSHGTNFSWPAFFAQGATQVLRERFEPKRVLQDFGRFRVSYVYMVPTMVQRILKEDDGSADVSSLRAFMYASAPMPVSVLREAIKRFGSIFYQVYTLSEAPVITTLMRPSEHVEKVSSCGSRLASCGRPVVTMELRLIAADGREASVGEVGEIAIRSLNSMSGYWNLPEQTAKTLVDGWVMTGDMARFDEDGFFYLVDRKNDVIITGGFNVYPKEVEDVLHEHPAVAQCAVVGVPDEEWGETVKAVVVMKPGQTTNADVLIEYCRNNLASYKKPRQVVFAESLPLTAVGKINRRALRPSGSSS